jgi:acyl carrier protein
MQSPKAHPSAVTLQAWLTARVATYVQRAPEQIQPDVPLTEYGLDSVYALTLSGDIEDHLGISVDPTVMWDHPTINALTQALLQLARQLNAA